MFCNRLAEQHPTHKPSAQPNKDSEHHEHDKDKNHRYDDEKNEMERDWNIPPFFVLRTVDRGQSIRVWCQAEAVLAVGGQ